MSDIQARGAVVSWSAPARPESENGSVEDDRGPQEPLNYEVSISLSGKDGKYKSMYWWVLAASCHETEQQLLLKVWKKKHFFLFSSNEAGKN